MFQCARPDMLGVGGGGGFALMLDAALESGSSLACETFATEGSIMGGRGQFKPVTIEVWGFK